MFRNFYFTDLAQEWLDLGADIIGGCCRIGPNNIKYLHNLINYKKFLMIRQIIALGGGGFTDDPGNSLLDDYLLKQSPKKLRIYVLLEQRVVMRKIISIIFIIALII